MESKLDDSFPIAQFNVPGYNSFRQDASATSGGLITWLRNDIPTNRRKDLELMNDNIQSLINEIHINKEKWFIISLYRLPNANVQSFCNHVGTIIDKVSCESSMIILLGDINIDMSRNYVKRKQFNEVLALYNLKNIVTEPTCFKGDPPTSIDAIITSNARRLGKVLNFNCGFSDYHNLIATSTKINVPKTEKKEIHYRSFKNFNDDNFCEDIRNIPTAVLSIFDDINDRHWAYQQLVMSVVNEHAPMKKRYVGKKCAHMNKDLRKAIYRKRMAYNKYIKNKRNNQLWEAYRQARNHYVKINKASMREYFKKRCADGPTSRSFWDTLKPYFTDKVRSASTIMLNENGEIKSDKQDIASIFSTYFKEITNQIGSGDDTNDMSIDDICAMYANHPNVKAISAYRETSGIINDFTFTHVSTEDVRKQLLKLNIKKSTGYDGLSPKLMKIAADALVPQMTKMINEVIDECSFPEILKLAEISPIFKKDDALDKTKYRPVSVLTCVSKIFERVLNEQFGNHFYAVFAQCLSAYRKNHDTQAVLLRAVDDWKVALDQGKIPGALLMDLSKAFDVIPHGLLIAKLKAYGYNTEVLQLLKSYLENRKQRVKIDDVRSQWTEVSMGVPQGSILGPTIFNVFLNDLFIVMDGTDIYNYADDNTISFSGTSVEEVIENLNESGTRVTEWFEGNYMKANPDKYQAIIFGKRQGMVADFKIKNASIQSIDNVKLLGLHIDNDLSFNDHSLKMYKKASRQVNAMMRLNSKLDFTSKISIYNSFIHSTFTYCPAVWLFCNKTNFGKLEKIQCRALRFLHNDFNATYDELLNKGDHKAISVILLHSLAIEVYKSINGIAPDYISSIFTIRDSNYELRSRQTVNQRRFKTFKYGYNSFGYLAAKVWNNVPNNIKEAPSLNTFKNRIAQWKAIGCLERLQ